MASPSFNQWEIWNVDWKHEDGMSKLRPALLASTPDYAAAQGLVWAMKITTSSRMTSDAIALDPSLPEWPMTGLTRPCFLFVAKIQVCPLSVLKNKRGEIPVTIAARAQELMARLTGLKLP